MSGRGNARTIDAGLPGAPHFEDIVAEVLRKGGWRVRRNRAARDIGADIVVNKDAKKYVVQLKSASEGRSDRLIPLLSQAILEARVFARKSPERASPLAVVAAPRVPASVADRIKQFAERHASGTAIGIIDAAGLRSFAGPGLEGLNAAPRDRSVRATNIQLPNLFSDLNQWMLKILLGQCLPEELISVPRGPTRNASRLAALSGVSIMTAARLVDQLAGQGFLDADRETLRIVRAGELLEQWSFANRKMSRELPARWIIKKNDKQLLASVARFAAGLQAPKSEAQTGSAITSEPRVCVGLFAAADVLGIGFVRGVAPQLYLERLDHNALQKMGLTLKDADRHADLHIRVPSNKEAVFRPCVRRHKAPVCDILQLWLDSSAYPARGREQADEIRRRVLHPLFAI